MHCKLKWQAWYEFLRWIYWQKHSKCAIALIILATLFTHLPPHSPFPPPPPPPQLPYHFSLLGLQLLLLLYVQLTISFLIGRKPTVNFPNQHLRHHLAADYTIIMSKTLKVTANHVIFDRGAWFLRVIMSSSRALCCLPSVKHKNLIQ